MIHSEKSLTGQYFAVRVTFDGNAVPRMGGSLHLTGAAEQLQKTRRGFPLGLFMRRFVLSGSGKARLLKKRFIRRSASVSFATRL